MTNCGRRPSTGGGSRLGPLVSSPFPGIPVRTIGLTTQIPCGMDLCVGVMGLFESGRMALSATAVPATG